MIWYLLYPLRGTTEAPILAPSHPIRSAFTRYGRYAARHVLTTLLVSSAVATVLICPFPFLYTTDFSNGASNLPHHVWTDAKPLQDQTGVEPDVIMRSIWVHGSYMKALEKDVLLGALDLQDELLGPTTDFNPRQLTNSVSLPSPTGDLCAQDRDVFHVFNGITNHSWFFHSPLQYWSCSHERISADPNIIATVNEKKTQPTSVNVTLRHSTVFSGKRFEDRRLVAADALVITLLHLKDSPVGKQWERKAEALAARVTDQWEVYPADGHSVDSGLYEFQFRPMSFQDTVILALAYCLTFLYFMISLSKLRAVKSKAGLILTVLTQIAFSIFSSFTVCAIFEIDLSKIPRAAYPLVVLAMSLENIFRLINAVILTPAQDSPGSRIGTAFGETGHIAVAGVVQNLLILWGLSNVVSSGVSAFCTFAAVAIVFDFFFLSTFFLSVLSIDVRRMELNDALERASLRSHASAADKTARKSWSEAILEGKIALSTRIAGTIVMLGFVLIAQWHFFEADTTISRLLRRLLELIRGNDNSKTSGSVLPVDVHQARSPTSWLRLQDHNSAREVIRVIKPRAHSYIARVFQPLVFVLKGSDRTPSDERTFLPAVYDFIHHYLPHFIVSVLVIVAAVRLLMNYLLWNKIAESEDGDDGSDEEPLMLIKTLDQGHLLDVVKMAGSTDGHIVSVGLDRLIRVWDIRLGSRSYRLPDSHDLEESPFPVLSMAIDEATEWLALLSPRKVFWWNLNEHRWGGSMDVDLLGHKPEGFFFRPRTAGLSQSLIVVRRSGTMVELWPEYKRSEETLICKTPLICVVSFQHTKGLFSIMTLSRRGCIHHVTHEDGNWVSREVEIANGEKKDLHSIIPLPQLSSYLLVRSESVDLVILRTGRLAHTFHTEPSVPKSMRIIQLRRRTAAKGSQGLGSLTMVYTNAETGDCVLQTYVPAHESQTICLCDPSRPASATCCRWKDTREIKRCVKIPGVWEALPTGSVIGARKKHKPSAPHPLPPAESQPLGRSTGLRRRGYKALDQVAQIKDEWEVWIMTQLDRNGDFATLPMDTAEELGNHLMVSQLGPTAMAGTTSLAVGLGNVIKLITAGHERFESTADRLGDEKPALAGTRRKRPNGSARHRASLGLANGSW